MAACSARGHAHFAGPAAFCRCTEYAWELSLAAVAQFERELIPERVSAGMRRAAARRTRSGKAIGRPRRVFDRAELVRLRQGGNSAKIAHELNVGVGTVVRLL